MHHPHTITIINIKEILNHVDVTQTIIIIALECSRQVQVDSQQIKKDITGITVKR